MDHGRSLPSEPSATAMPPPFGRVTLRSILVNVHCLPLRWSSTVRLPPCNPISVSSRPSSPLASRRSIQAISAARLGTLLRTLAGAAGARGAAEAGGSDLAAAAARSAFAGERIGCDGAGAEAAEAVTKGRLLLPAKTVSLLSDSLRTALSAPTNVK